MRNVNERFASQSVSGTTPITFAKIDAQQLITISFQAVFTDLAVGGTLKIQMSNDPCAYGNTAGVFTPTNWTDIPNATATVTAGLGGIVSLQQVGYRWMRAIFTPSAGAGTCFVQFNAMGV